MDPALQELLAGEPSEEIEAIIKLTTTQSIPSRVRVVARFGPIITCRTERRYIREVWSHPDVLSFKAPRLVAVEPEIFDLEAANDTELHQTDLRRPDGLQSTGRGVVVGLIDVGCDFAHPNFCNSEGSTRLLALWDQSNPVKSQLVPYGYGRVYSRDDINAALASSNPYLALGYSPAKADPAGVGAHGTLVMDVAAGNGRVDGSPAGIAPEADLVFVHVNTRSPAGNGNLGDSVRILEALDFISRIAGDQPQVINISLGRRAGPHDGSSLVEQAIDSFLLEAPGRAIVQSTGNYFASGAHASGQLRPGERRVLTWRIDPAHITPNELEVWYSGKDTFAIELSSPDGRVNVRAILGEGCPVTVGDEVVGHLYHRFRDPNNGDHHIDIFLNPPAPGGAWRVALIGDDVVDGKFHAWVERDLPCPHCDSRFEPGDVDATGTTGTICNGFRTIATGAVDAHSAANEIARFSSCGPTRDYRAKPDLVAPGVKILGARSAPSIEIPGVRQPTRMSGTSFAAPHVTGTIALMFEAARRPLRIEETRRLLLTSTTPLQAGDRVRVGSGLLNIERAVTAAAMQAKSIATVTVPILQEESTAVAESTQGDSIKSVSNAAESGAAPESPSIATGTTESPDVTSRPSIGDSLVLTATLDDLDERYSDSFPEADMTNTRTPEPTHDITRMAAIPMGLDGGERSLTEVADDAVASGQVREPGDLLRLAVRGNGGTPKMTSPAALFDTFARSPVVTEPPGFELVARPGDLVRPGLLRSGDIVIRRALGEGQVAHDWILASGELLKSEHLTRLGLRGERSRFGVQPGLYVHVIEGGPFAHQRADGFARYLGNREGWLSRDTIILRPQVRVRVSPEMLTIEASPEDEWFVSSFLWIDDLARDEKGNIRLENGKLLRKDGRPIMRVNGKEEPIELRNVKTEEDGTTLVLQGGKIVLDVRDRPIKIRQCAAAASAMAAHFGVKPRGWVSPSSDSKHEYNFQIATAFITTEDKKRRLNTDEVKVAPDAVKYLDSELGKGHAVLAGVAVAGATPCNLDNLAAHYVLIYKKTDQGNYAFRDPGVASSGPSSYGEFQIADDKGLYRPGKEDDKSYYSQRRYDVTQLRVNDLLTAGSAEAYVPMPGVLEDSPTTSDSTALKETIDKIRGVVARGLQLIENLPSDGPLSREAIRRLKLLLPMVLRPEVDDRYLYYDNLVAAGAYLTLTPEQFNVLLRNVRGNLLSTFGFASGSDDKIFVIALKSVDDMIFLSMAYVRRYMETQGAAAAPAQVQMNDWIGAQQRNPNSIYQCYR